MLMRLFTTAANREPVQEYFTSDEIMNSILSGPESVLSPGGRSRSHSRGRLVKKNKPSPTSTTRPKTATGPGTVNTYTSSRPSTSTSEYITANSSVTSLNAAPYTQEPLPLPKISEFERRSLTGKRREADNGPLPPPIKITPLGQGAGGSFPPTPPGSYSGSSAGELTATLLSTSRTESNPSRFLENISSPSEKEIVARPSSMGSIFGRGKSKERVLKERDTSTFFGRDGELGDIEVQQDLPDVPPRSFFRGRSHSRSASHSPGKSNVASNGGILVNSAPSTAIRAIPLTPEMEATHPAHRSPPPPGTVATTTITTTTTHYHLTGQTVEEKHPSFLPPLHLPQLELTFDGGNFPSSRRPISSAPALPSPERRKADMESYRGSGSGSSNSSKEELDSGPSSSSNSSRQVLQESKSDKRPKGPIKPAPLFSGTNREKRGGPPISFYNSSQELYHPHLRQEKTSCVGSGAHGERIPENGPEPRVAELSGCPPTPMRSLTRGGYSGKAMDRRRSYGENARARDTQRMDVEEVFRDIEATKNGGKGRENSGTGFVTIGGGESVASSKRNSRQDELPIELEKRIDMGKGKEKENAAEVSKSAQTVPASPILPKPQSEVSGGKEPELFTKVEPGFVFPFAQAVTVDEPVPLLSTNQPSVYSNPRTPPTTAGMAINEAYHPVSEISSSHEEVARPKTAPSTGMTSKPAGLGIGRETDNGFVGGWKLGSMRMIKPDSIKPAAASLSTHTKASVTSSNHSSSAITLVGSADVPSVGHCRKFSYQTIEGIALVEGGKMGNWKEVKLADLLVVEQGGQQKQQKQEPGDRPTYIPFRPVTIIEPMHSAPPGTSAEVIVLADGSTLPAPILVGSSPGKPRRRAESPHWEPMVPVDRSKNKQEEKDEKRKSKRRWFGSHRKSKDVEGGNKNRHSGLGSGLSNASSSSRSSKGSSKSGGTQQPIPPSTSGSDETATPPDSSASNTSSMLGGKAGSAPEPTRVVAEFPYTSKKVALVATAAHPAGPPHPLGRPSTSGQFPLPAGTPITAIPTSSRGRARTRESGLRYEVRGGTSPVTADGNKEAAGSMTSLIAKGNSPAPQHSRNPSSPRPGSSGTGSGPKPLGKLFVVCCNCEYWHDLPSQMYYEMHEMGCSVNCVYCLHKMEVRCCSGYSCAVYVLEKHHGK
ncbi:hypothetical protein L211DRAFT_852563 [Terfezia boudieri ATCC MYA-4762]|uniref:Uncharacterized protein n=1 Tax=Terfezia boudieri ATCC MYA-4762 TaxID=1051890 RepID=A0A3N4LBA5_9PEZI|nr:hypothetical protein L211DRAFT_852563 [Terfezia boudieri ATCC MYA-4762]